VADDGVSALSNAFAELRGNVLRALGDGTDIMKELRDELRMLRQAIEDTRSRVTALEGRVAGVEAEQQRRRKEDDDRHWHRADDRRTVWQVVAMAVIAAAGWVYGALHGRL
jgi:phage shock protein A